VNTKPALILASASPRRAALLRESGYEFAVHPADFDEDNYFGKLMPIQLATFLAKAKAEQIANRFGYEVTLAADTVVAFGDIALGTPGDEGEARQMIELLSGTTHVVITGVAVRCPARDIDLDCTVLSAVRMRVLTGRELDEYVASGRWKGKAGGYGIQDEHPIVTCVGGSVSNVIGLPMEQTRRLLEQADVVAKPVP
jgi:septum formation protein